jgi:hypothetical protein
MEYRTVFDVTEAGFRQWTFGVQGLIPIAFGLARPALIRAGIFKRQSPRMEKWFPRIFIGFATLWTVIAFVGPYAAYRSAVSAMRENRVDHVEGAVTEFRPMPFAGHANESFTVKGIKFKYSDFLVSAGFNNTASHGGPIKEGLPVRIWHRNGEILKLDVGTKE